MKLKTPVIRSIIIVSILVLSVISGLIFSAVCNRIDLKKYPMPDNYKEYVTKYAKEYAVPEHMIYAVIKNESNFDKGHEGSDNGIGLMGITFKEFDNMLRITGENLTKDALYGPETNIKYGTYYLSRLYNRFGDWDTAIAAYNGGEGNVSEWLADSRYSDDGVKLNIEKIPDSFRETKNYVKKVNKALKKYGELYDKK